MNKQLFKKIIVYALVLILFFPPFVSYALILMDAFSLEILGYTEGEPIPLLDSTGDACGYQFTILIPPPPATTYSFTVPVQCNPNKGLVCSRNDFTTAVAVFVSNSFVDDIDVSTFCLKRSGESCTEDAECEQNNKCDSGTCAKDVGSGIVAGLFGGSVSDIRDVIRIAINVILGFLGVAAVLMIVWGGFTWLTSGGSEEKVDKGKRTLIWAALGAIIISIAWTISSYVLSLGETLGN